MDFASKAIHAGQDPAKWTHRAVIPPISMATTFQQFAPAQHAVIIIILFVNLIRKFSRSLLVYSCQPHVYLIKYDLLLCNTY